MKKRICAMLLAVVLTLSLVGCSNSDSKKLVGTWRCEMDLTGILEESLAGADEMFAELADFTPVIIVLYADFKEDGTVAIYADEQQADEAFEKLLDEFVVVLEEYMVEQIYEQTGMQMTIEEILELTGLNIKEELEKLGLENLSKEMCKEMAQEGKYKAENGKLHISDSVVHNIDPAVYETYVLDGDVLTLTGYVGMSAPEYDLYPMVFHKIG